MSQVYSAEVIHVKERYGMQMMYCQFDHWMNHAWNKDKTLNSWFALEWSRTKLPVTQLLRLEFIWPSGNGQAMSSSRPSGDHWQKGPWKSQSIITPDLIELGIDAGPRLVSITGVGWPLDPGLSAIRVHPFRSYLMPFSDLTHIRWPDYSAASCRPVAAIFWQCAWHKRRTGHRKLIVTGIVIFSWTLTGA